MKNLLIIFTFLIGTTLTAQSIERQVIGSTGGTFTAGGLTVTSTVGETSVSTYTGSLTLTQGYQQANDSNSVSIKEILVNATYSLFPNPTTGNSTLAITTENLDATLQIEIYSASGKLISTSAKALVAGQKSTIPLDLTSQAAGVYFVKLRDAENHLSKTLRIIKQ